MSTTKSGRPRRRHSKAFKLQVLEEKAQGRLTEAELAQKYGIHRSMISYWAKRYREQGEAGLENHSPAPKSRPRQTPPEVQARVVEAKDLATFFLRGGTRVWLIMVLDDHSRFIVNWGAYRQAKADHVIEVLVGAMARYGLPGEILTDQGAQFVSWQGVTRFQKLLGKLGVAHVKARPHYPQTLGKTEAGWRNMQRELLDVELFRSFEEAVQRIGDWVEHYNYARTHQGIGGFTPADRYFGIAEAVQAHLEEARRQRQQGMPDQVQVARPSLGYLVGRVFGHEVRLKEQALARSTPSGLAHALRRRASPGSDGDPRPQPDPSDHEPLQPYHPTPDARRGRGGGSGPAAHGRSLGKDCAERLDGRCRASPRRPSNGRPVPAGMPLSLPWHP